MQRVAGFTGVNNPFLTWDESAQDFSQQDNFSRDISITIVNASADDQPVILNPSRKPSNPARVIAPVIVYAVGAANLTATIDINTIAEFLAQIKDEPIYLLGIKVTSNKESIGSQSMLYTKHDVFKPTADARKFSFSRSQSQFAQNNKIFDVKMPKLLLSNNTELSVVIPKTEEGEVSTSVTFQLQFGVAASLHAGLEGMAVMAGAQ